MTTQTKTTYTPGPWELVHHTAPEHDGDRAIYGPGKNAKFICDMNGGPNDDSETLANARLIASAPELLEIAHAYRNLLKSMSHSDGEVATFNYIESVLAKAEGRI